MENMGQSYGIKVLTAPEAMGHHFEALFLIGLNQEYSRTICATH